MIIKVPYYSQYIDVANIEWQSRACGVACLKMLLGAQVVRTPSIDEMIRQGEAIGAYGPSGWTHDGLLALAQKYYTKLSRTEWRQAEGKTADELNEEGIAFLISELRSGHPIIVSAIKNFEVVDKFHMVVLTGFEEEDGKVTGFYYHDPDCTTRSDGVNRFVPVDVFPCLFVGLA